ncbi:MAG: hypothetical protein ACK480_04290 [Planctomycetota bacterium]
MQGYQAIARVARFLWSDRLFRPASTARAPQHITHEIRILPPPPTCVGAKPGYATPQYFGGSARLERRLDLGCATRNATPQAPRMDMHGAFGSPKELARSAKKPTSPKKVES